MTPNAQTSADPRVSAALAVLAGEPADDVAGRMGLPVALVVRWTQSFVAAGSSALRGDHGGDPAHRDRFLALVSHELRTPLAVMRGWAETLRTVPDVADDPELLATGLAAISGHTERLTRLSCDLIDSAAVTLGRLRLEVCEVDLGAVANEVAASFEGDRIEVDVPNLALSADPDRLGQILTNLLHDGLGRTHGTLRLTADSDTAWVTLRLDIPATPPSFDEMHALFEPFDAGTGDVNTGLSLYVCRALAVAHGGQCGVDADDTLAYWVRLPIDGSALLPSV